MNLLAGVLLGLGAFCIWWSAWVPEPKTRHRLTWNDRMRDTLVHAGARGVTPAALVAASIVLGLVVFVLVTGLSRAPAVALAFGVIAGALPSTLVRARARRRLARLRDVWPEVVDHLGSGIRAGMSLPEALSALSERGPEPLRKDFGEFAADYRVTGRFDECLTRLKDRLADPIADRIIEALRITREVGGTDLGRLLRTLSSFLRADAHTRGELLARQSWTVNAARLAVAAPWLVLALLATRPEAVAAYNSVTGFVVILAGGALTVIAYRLMIRLGRLPLETRVLR